MYSFVNRNFIDFCLCRADFIHSRLMILYTNADTFLNKQIELRLIIEASCHDVVVITEVLSKKSRFCVNKSVVYLDGYQLLFNCDYYEASRGILHYVRSYISVTIDTNLTCGGFHESMRFRISLMKGDSLLLGCIYTSPSSSASSNDNLIDLLSNVGEDKASHRFIIGDLNWRKIQWNDGCGFLPDTCSIDDQEQRFMRCVDDNFLPKYVNFPTRLRGCDQQSLLDLAFTNESYMVGKVEALCPLGPMVTFHLILHFYFTQKAISTALLLITLRVTLLH